MHDALWFRSEPPVPARSVARFRGSVPLRHIPQLQRFVRAAGEREAAIGREGNQGHGAVMSGELVQFRASGGNPER